MGLGGIGLQELLVIFLLVLLLFGAKRLPEVGKALGRGIREFKKATKEIQRDVDLDDYEKKPTRGDEDSPKKEQPREEDSAD
jgi:sec-independent protein translocase protein TatA